MADRPPDTGEATGAGPDRESTTRTPRWVWVVGIIIIVASLVMLARMLIIPLLMGGMGH
jgi:hypothetical protein